MPENTETIVTAQSFKIEGPRKQGSPFDIDWRGIQSLSLGDLQSLEESAGLNQLVGRTVAVAIDAGRDFEVVSSFGSLRYEGCSVIRFQEPLPDAGRGLVSALRGEAKEVRTVAGHDVFVFPDRVAMETVYRPKPWQGQFVSLPAPDTLLCATSDRFLREVLERWGRPVPGKRALPPELQEWMHVDAMAPAWALRHVAKGPAHQGSLVGLTWCLKPQGREVFEVRYLPVQDQNVRFLADVWDNSMLEAHPAIEEKADGTMTVTVDCQKEALNFWYLLLAHRSMGEQGIRGEYGPTGSEATP
ncbi:MAG TPA: hypothetical protein VG826_14310 [Pirellulales bacterium]|nr:hypothetical protein [Pirellulales bacterium]